MFTVLMGLPSRNARILRWVQSWIRMRLSIGAQAIWGVTMQLGADFKGFSGFIGSAEITSQAKPLSLPLSSAAQTASSSTNGPRAVFIRMAPSFILEIESALIIPLFSEVSGQCREMMSAVASSSSKFT